MSNGESNGESTTPTQGTGAPITGNHAPAAAETAAQHPVEDPEDNVGNLIAAAPAAPAVQDDEDAVPEEPGDNIGNTIGANKPAAPVEARGDRPRRDRDRDRGKKPRTDGPRPEGQPAGGGGGGGGGERRGPNPNKAADLQHRAFKVGDKVRAKVLQLGPGGALCDLWGKEKGVLDLRELATPEGAAPQVGDSVDVIVLQDGTRGGGNLVVTRDPNRAERNREMVVQAFNAGDAIEGLITGLNRGGLEVDIGGVRGFCPSSQIDVRVPSQPELAAMVLRREIFKVTSLSDREAVVSRRALRETDIRERAEQAVAAIKVGERVKGRVVAVRDHGIFVDLGGVEGRIQLSEISHDRGTRPQDVAKVGEEIEALVLRIDVPQAQPAQGAEAPKAEAEAAPEATTEAAPAEGAETAEATPAEGASAEGDKGDKHKGDKKKPQRFSRLPEGTPRVELSRRAIEVDPWADVHKRYPPGSVHKGRVARMQPFGAFIELEKGVDGLLHVSEIDLDGRRVQHPNEVLKEAQEVTVRVARVDKGQRRIALAMLPEGVTEEQLKKSVNPKLGMIVMAKIADHDNFGVYAQIEGTFGKVGRGFIAPPDSGLPRGADLKKSLPVGADVKVKIVEMDRGRLKLSIRAAVQDEERQAYRAYQQTANATSVGVSLADKLRKLNLSTRG
jgi:small subunit ribosomal protein S1